MDNTKKEELFPYFAYLYSQQLDPEKYGQAASIEEWTNLIQSNEEDINAIAAAAEEMSDEEWAQLEEQYIAETQSASAQFAAKGAKLKKLKSGGKKKKCACGCDIISRKVGGKIVERCSCGCDTKKVVKAQQGVRVNVPYRRPADPGRFQLPFPPVPIAQVIAEGQAAQRVAAAQQAPAQQTSYGTGNIVIPYRRVQPNGFTLPFPKSPVVNPANRPINIPYAPGVTPRQAPQAAPKPAAQPAAQAPTQPATQPAAQPAAQTPAKSTAQASTKPAAVRPRSDARMKDYQKNLELLGFTPGKQDGIYGAKTKAAIQAFQKAHGLKVDGIIGDETRNAMAQAITQHSLLKPGPGAVSETHDLQKNRVVPKEFKPAKKGRVALSKKGGQVNKAYKPDFDNFAKPGQKPTAADTVSAYNRVNTWADGYGPKDKDGKILNTRQEILKTARKEWKGKKVDVNKIKSGGKTRIKN
jgi:hypothetical protein